MAKLSSRRRSVLENPDEVLNLAQEWLQVIKRRWKWLALGGAALLLVLAAWGVNNRMQAAREKRAAAALVAVRAKFPLAATNPEAVKALQELVSSHSGTRAADEAQSQRANLLYRLQNYGEAAKAFEALQQKGDPGWEALVSESLSYCYEGLGDFKKAAAALEPLAEQKTGKNPPPEVMQRLALLYEKAGDSKKADEFWNKLLEMKPTPAMTAYLKEKVAAAEAPPGTGKK